MSYNKCSYKSGIAALQDNQILGFVRRNITEKKLIIPLHKVVVRPHLEYRI